MEPRDHLQRAIACLGGTTPLATAIGGNVKRQHVEYWLKNGNVPAQHCPAIERETRRVAAEQDDDALIVTCEQLCPGPAWEVLRLQAAPATEREAA